jgi:sirohydrochlorin cobaltochelatase
MPASDTPPSGSTPPETGIVLAAHGSRLPAALASLEAFARRIEAAYPGCTGRPARTMGEMHRGRHLRPLFGAKSVDAALLDMARRGVTRGAVQSLHVVAGGEFTQVVEGARRARNGGAFAAVAVGGPLLRGPRDAAAVAGTLLASLPRERTPDEAVAVMGHGARGPAREIYAALAGELSRRDALVFFSTLDRTREDAARPDSNIGRLREAVLRSGARRAWLVPFFSVAGAHARRDLAGDEDHSWRGVLSRAGIECLPALSGLLELPRFARVFQDRLDAALAQMATPQKNGADDTVGAS